MRRATFIAAVAVALTSVAKAEPPEVWPPPLSDSCQMAHVDEQVDTLRRLPPVVLSALAAKLHEGYPDSVPPIADRGEIYNSSDVVMRPLSNHRFVNGGRVGTKWFVWYEQGGRGNYLAAAAFDVRADGSVAFIGKSPSYDNLCRAIEALLEGKPYRPKRP